MILPAIDLIDGNVVRLYQGDYQQKTEYSTNPIELVNQYAAQGSSWLHIVDLTGAKDTEKRQLELIGKMVATGKMNFQAGGGVRSEQDVKQLLEVGVKRIVIGSLAVNNPDLICEWLTTYGGETIVLALDINIDSNGKKSIATHGWQQNSGVELETLMDKFLKFGLKHVLCTDISKDGTLTGPNEQLYSELAKKYPNVSWQASGGMSSLDDIDALAPAISKSGLQNDTPSAIILGRALLEGRFTVEQAITRWNTVKN